MPCAGTFSPPASPGEQQSFSIDFSAQVPAGQTISSASATLSVKFGDDGDAASRLIGQAAVTGKTLSQVVSGLLPATTYILTLTATLAPSGSVLVNYAYLHCAAIE
jgi:hypothetical protein